MEQFSPSQISWTSFPNRHPTSISQFWPPSNSSRSRETTPETTTDSTLEPTNDTSVSSRHTVADLNCLYLPPPLESCVGHAESIESLRSFVNKEIGLNAINHRMSLPVIEERPASSWYTSDSDSINLATWTREQAIRDGQDNHVHDNPAQGNSVQVETQSTVKSTVKRHYVTELKGKLLAPPQVLSGLANRCIAKCRNRSSGLKRRAKAAVGKILEKISRLVG